MCNKVLVLFLSIITAVYANGDESCPFTLLGTVYGAVRFQPCEYDRGWIFCEDSGWGDEEATVVCRDKNESLFGLGDYIDIIEDDREVGFSSINCTGHESELDECTVGDITSYECTEVAVAKCFHIPQVVVSIDDFVEVYENENIEFCVFVWGPLTDDLLIMVVTNDSSIAEAGYDYHPLNQIITFESTDSPRSEQCLEIDIIDDSLPESWEMFSVLLSTNSTDVDITQLQGFNVFIRPNDESEPVTVDPQDQGSSGSGDGDGTSRKATGEVITIIVVVILLLVILGIIVIVVAVTIFCIKQRPKQKLVNAKSITLKENHIYETSTLFSTRQRDRGGEKHLDNPMYNPGNMYKEDKAPQVDKPTEYYHLQNPLYALKSVVTTNTNKMLECEGPEYAVPGLTSTQSGKSTSAANLPVTNEAPEYAVPERTTKSECIPAPNPPITANGSKYALVGPSETTPVVNPTTNS